MTFAAAAAAMLTVLMVVVMTVLMVVWLFVFRKGEKNVLSGWCLGFVLLLFFFFLSL